MPFPTTDDRIDAAEKVLAIKLPWAWRDRLLRANGGELDGGWQVFPVQDTSDRKRAGRTANHLVHENATARGWPGFPAEAVAIGEDGSGNYLVLLRSGSALELGEQVYCWDHETGELTAVGSCGDLE